MCACVHVYYVCMRMHASVIAWRLCTVHPIYNGDLYSGYTFGPEGTVLIMKVSSFSGIEYALLWQSMDHLVPVANAYISGVLQLRGLD